MASTVTTSIRLDGLDEVVAKLGKISVSLLDLSPSMKETGEYLTNFFSGEVFASRGAVIGKPWAPLTPSYAARKAKFWPGRPPLMRTNFMNKSFKSDYGPLYARIFNEADYFDEHQEGTRKLPARVMMAVDEQRTSIIAKIIAKDIAAKLDIA